MRYQKNFKCEKIVLLLIHKLSSFSTVGFGSVSTPNSIAPRTALLQRPHRLVIRNTKMLLHFLMLTNFFAPILQIFVVSFVMIFLGIPNNYKSAKPRTSLAVARAQTMMSKNGIFCACKIRLYIYEKIDAQKQPKSILLFIQMPKISQSCSVILH